MKLCAKMVRVCVKISHQKLDAVFGEFDVFSNLDLCISVLVFRHTSTDENVL